MDKKFQIFVSSTFEDLQDERRSVIEQILNLGHIPVGMEWFNAADETQWSYIKRRIDQSDYYLVVVAERYGSTEQATGKSFTQKEYEYAISQGKPTVAFLLAEFARATWPSNLVEYQRKAEIEQFRQICKSKMVKFWRNADHLASVVSASLSELLTDRPGVGWIRGDVISPNVLAEMSALSSENRSLKEEVRSLESRISQTLFIPADARVRLRSLSKAVLLLGVRATRSTIETNVSVLEAFLFLAKELAIGLGSYGMESVVKGTLLDIPDGQYLLSEDAYAEMSQSNLIDSRLESSGATNHPSKVWYLTEYGKNFILYAEESKKSRERSETALAAK